MFGYILGGDDAAVVLAQILSALCSELELQLNKLIVSETLDQANSTATELLICVERNEMTLGEKALLMSRQQESGFCVDGGTKRRICCGGRSSMVRDQLGPEKADLLACIGTMRLHNGDWKHAERMLRESLELQRRVGGAEGTIEIFTLHSLGSLLLLRRRYEEATEVLN